MEFTLFFDADARPPVVDTGAPKILEIKGLYAFPSEADVIAEVILTGENMQQHGMPTAARIKRIIQASDARVQPGQEIPIKFRVSSCGPSHKSGEKGIIAAKVGTDIEERLVLCLYSLRVGDGQINPPSGSEQHGISDCNPFKINAAKQVKQAAENGDLKAQIALAHMYEYGKNVGQNNAEAIKWYHSAAKNGDTEAMINLSEIYAHGLLGAEQNDTEAISWLKRAVEQGAKNSKPNLEKLEKIKLFKAAAQKGDAEAQYELGREYFSRNYNMRLNDIIRRENSAEAIKNLKSAAAQGHTKAMSLIGDMYFGHGYGTGMTMDLAEALKWYRLGAENGDAEAQFKLGNMHLYGHGVERNEAEALMWLRRAAEKENLQAKILLEDREDRKLKALKKQNKEKWKRRIIWALGILAVAGLIAAALMWRSKSRRRSEIRKLRKL